MYSLPTTVNVGDKTFHIRDSGDFRIMLDCFAALQDESISEDARILASLIIFYEDFEEIEDLPRDEDTLKAIITEMYRFFNCGSDSAPGMDMGVQLIDWERDSQMICAAINNVANTEVRALKNLHWWTFLGYYASVGQSMLSTVVSIRDKITRGKKLEKWEQEFKRSNPEYFIWRKRDVADIEFEKRIREQFHKGGDK